MKKLFTLVAVAMLSASTIAVAADEETKELDAKKLPSITQSILKSYFPGAQVVKAWKHKSKVRNSFDVTLDDGTELEFDKDGQWTHVYCQGEAIPERMVPGKVKMHLSQTVPDAVVVEMEKTGKGNYTIKLADGTTLNYDNQFRPIK